MKKRLPSVFFLAAIVMCMSFLTFSYPENRTQIKASLTKKVSAKKPLVVHVLVPLCDNEHQGIVPTSASLGNGLSLKSNLYWATSKGMKRYFKEQSDWKLLFSHKDPSANILERVVFKKTYASGTSVIMVADAYRGDRMKACLQDYFKALAGDKKDSVKNEGLAYGIYGHADLVAFNGHNGLMDEQVTVPQAKNNRSIDAVAIACYSKSYFNDEFKKVNAYPLVTTTHLLYPGAPVMEYIIDSWANLKDAEKVRWAAGDAYLKMKPKSGHNGAHRLFASGW